MARYYRRRYTRTVVPKKKWASNVKVVTNQPIQAGQYFTLVENSVQTSSPTPTIIKCGNFKLSMDCVVTFPGGSVASASPCAVFTIMYIPEGWTMTDLSSAVTAHPEWIMAMKTVGGTYSAGTVLSLETVNMSSRLKRNLNSGDKIVLYTSVNVTGSSGIELSGVVRYWTCAN